MGRMGYTGLELVGYLSGDVLECYFGAFSRCLLARAHDFDPAIWW